MIVGVRIAAIDSKTWSEVIISFEAILRDENRSNVVIGRENCKVAGHLAEGRILLEREMFNVSY